MEPVNGRFLGKLPAKRDARNLDAFAFIRGTEPELPAAPPRYNFESRRTLPVIDQGQHNDCTAVALAGVVSRYIYAQTGHWNGPDRERRTGELTGLLAFYDRYKIPPDEGAYMKDALDLARREGVPLGPKGRTFRIAGYAEVKAPNPDNLRRALYQYKVLYVGTYVTSSFMRPSLHWLEPVAGDTIVGGHALCLYRHAEPGLVFKPSWYGYPSHFLTDAYVDRYVDEAYVVIPEDYRLAPAAVDHAAFVEAVAEVTGG